MVSRIDIILMYVKFGDDPIGSLDFSFIGGGTLKSNFTYLGDKFLKIAIEIFEKNGRNRFQQILHRFFNS